VLTIWLMVDFRRSQASGSAAETLSLNDSPSSVDPAPIVSSTEFRGIDP